MEETRAGGSIPHESPWRAISQVHPYFSPLTRFHVGDGSKVKFWEDTWVEDQSFVTSFPWLYRQSSRHNDHVACFTLSIEGIVSWNFHFNCNLSDRETPDILALLNVLEPMHLFPQQDRRIWTPDPTGIYTCKSFFDYLKK